MVVRVLLFLDATLDGVLLASVGSLLIACFSKTHTVVGHLTQAMRLLCVFRALSLCLWCDADVCQLTAIYPTHLYLLVLQAWS